MPDYSGLLGALNAVGPQMQPMNVTDQTPATPNPVPTFTPPPNPAVPIHHGFLSRIGAALTNGVAPVPSGLNGLLSPDDLKHARSAGWLALSNSLLNPSLDARGFKQSTLGSIASGLQNAQQASAGSMGGALQASQYATGLAQNQRVLQARAQVGQMLQPQANDAVDHDAMLNRIERGVFTLTAVGDDKGATALDGLAKGIREGRITAQQANQYMQDQSGIFQIDKATGNITKIHDNTVTPVKLQQAQDREDTANLNAGTHRQSTFQTQFVKPFEKPAQAFANWHAVLPQAATNPAATKAAVTAFVGAMEPNVQLRYATLQYLSNVDPSLAGQIKRAISTGEYGTIPPAQLAEMDAVVKAKEASMKSQFQSTTAKGLTGYRELKGQAPSWEDLTGASGAPAAAAPVAPPANPFRKP